MVSILALALGCVAARAATAFELYAYGTDIGGLQVVYLEGQAYIASTPPTNSMNVSFPTPPTSTNTTLPATPPSDPSSSYLFALPSTTSSFSPIIFASDIPSDYTSSGFGFYGALLFHDDSGTGDIETEFYAVADETLSGVWALYWKGSEATASGTVVALRTTAPSSGKVRRRGVSFEA